MPFGVGLPLNRVDRAAFFSRFNEGEAVPYFYEPFLAAFDPQLRKQLGVWYTPPEVGLAMRQQEFLISENSLSLRLPLID